MKKIFACLLGLLGFAGCDDIVNGGEEYGTPYVEFSLKGTVTDGEKAIENVKIESTQTHPYLFSGPWKTITTNAKGEFELSGQEFPNDTIGIRLVANDPGGKYQNDTTEVLFFKGDFSGKKKKDSWYEGSAEKTVNITLKKKS